MDAVADIKDRLSIEEVVGDYVQLKNAGSNYKGLCPFHQEKTPSFIVSPDKGIFHCFGCDSGGDIFTFIQKADGLEFREALEVLAQKAGVELPEKGGENTQAAKKRKARLQEALNTAAQYYHIQLSKNEGAKDYVQQQRQFSNDTIKDFKLGWAPAEGGRLVNFLRSKGYKDEELIDVGLAKQQNQSLRDLFWGRIMVPFFSNQGQIIGFTGRVIDEGMPKYLNTPQTRLFDKSRFIFGLYQAKPGIKSADEVVIVEGNLDVISSYQAGVKNVVALSGTALTHAQMKMLSRLTSNVTFAFDADAAGIRATERSISLAQEAGVNLSVVTLPGDSDPDDIIKADPEKWRHLLEEKQYVIDWLINTFRHDYDLDTAAGKKDFTSRISDSLRQIKDPVEQEHYINTVADITNVAPAAIANKLSQKTVTQKNPYKRVKGEAADATSHDDVTTVATALLSLAVAYPETRSALEDTDTQFLEDSLADILEYTKNSSENISSSSIPKDLQDKENYVKILLLRGEEEYGPWALLDRQVEAFGLAHRLQELQNRRNKQRLSREIAAAEAAGDNELRQKLLKQYQSLNNLST